MKLVPSRPVTIHSVRYGERWFPLMFRHTDGSLLLYMSYGHDAHFAPMFRLRSTDEGRTWQEATDNVPRICWAHSFRDGELFELDSYGFLDPAADAVYCHYGAWSCPGKPGDIARKELVKVHAPSLRPFCILDVLQGSGGYPTFHWWPLYNSVLGKPEVSSEEVFMGGPYVNTGIELDEGRLLALGYGDHRHDSAEKSWMKSCTVCLESRDRGHTWEEISVVARDSDMPEGYNEATLVQLKNGQLYSVIRTGDLLHHVWSDDLGRTWSTPEPIRLVDSDMLPRMVFPVMKMLDDGTLVLVYGRPGKHIIFDPSGTGRQWQGHLDLHAWELETQELKGVPPEQRLHGKTHLGIRYWDSSDYLALVPAGPREMLVAYDVQSYVESWNALPVSGIRMVQVRLEDG